MKSFVVASLLAIPLLWPPSVQGTQSAARVTREHFVPPGREPSYHRYHYTPVVRVGDQVYVSGIPAAVGENYEDKVRGMFEQLKAQLELAGASLGDVVELTSYHANSRDPASFSAEIERFLKIHRQYFPSYYPAWTAVGNTSLLSPDAPVELRAIAIIGSGKNPKADVPTPTRASTNATHPSTRMQP